MRMCKSQIICTPTNSKALFVIFLSPWLRIQYKNH